MRLPKDLTEPDLEKIESLTIGHYDNNASAFFAGTIDHDVSQNYSKFFASLDSSRRLNILDFGCGPGRDLKYFSELGHNVTGLDGSLKFCEIARQYSGCNVLHQSFLKLTLPPQTFDGIFANASLFHIPAAKLISVLATLHEALQAKGILFMSNPRGNSEGWSGQRYGNYMELNDIQQYLAVSGFTILDFYYRPSGVPIEQQPWLAVVSQRD
ncbi:MAG: SAM-dependent methyltransferase [Gammaproteobacteria bacterium]|jgi:SAM-dependent methyltransferase